LGFKAPLQHRQSRHMPSKSASKLFDHKDFLATLTSRPGVYRMLDADGAVLYVGKERNLKNRVSSYFRASGLAAKTMAMVAKIASMEVTVTNSETEALLLEQSLIKTFRLEDYTVARVSDSFEQIYGAPVLSEALFAELGTRVEEDALIRVHFDGSYDIVHGDIAVLGASEESEAAMNDWLTEMIENVESLAHKVDLAMQAWWMVLEGKSFVAPYPAESVRRDGWKNRLDAMGLQLEIGWLQRDATTVARYTGITLNDLQQVIDS